MRDATQRPGRPGQIPSLSPGSSCARGNMIARSSEVCDMRQDDALPAAQRLAESSLAILNEWPGSFYQDLIRLQQIRALLHRIQVVAFVSAFNEDAQNHILLAEQVPQAFLSRGLFEPRHERFGTAGAYRHLQHRHFTEVG